MGSPHADGQKQREAVIPSPREEYVWLSLGAGLYAAFDLVWIVVQPSVSKRPRQMVLHHAATLTLARIAFVANTHALTA